MFNSPYFLLRFVGVVLLLCSFSQQAQATHTLGCTISYRCLGADQYEFTVTCYYDCNTSSGLGNSQSVRLTSTTPGCVLSPNTVRLDRVDSLSNVDVSPLCDITTSTCNGGTQPGIGQMFYKGIITLPSGCVWTASITNCCRTGAITNLQNPTSRNTYVSTTIDTRVNPCNNSVQFSNLPTFYTCDSVWTSYNHGVFDPDGDTLVFSLVAPAISAGAGGSPIPFVGGLSATTPIAIEPGTVFQFDSTTGVMTFLPLDNTTQITMVAVKIEEIRNGVVIATTYREVQITVLTNCNNTSPTVAQTNNVQGSIFTFDSSSYSMCRNALASFTILAQDVNGDSLTVTSNGTSSIPNGAMTYIVDNSVRDSVLITFFIDPSLLTPGIYPFTVTVNDNFCPIPSINFSSFALRINGADFSRRTYCQNDQNPVPIIIGDSTGTFVQSVLNAPGLVMDSITGIIDLSTSLVGVYDVIYLVDTALAICPSDSIRITIEPAPDPTFTYPQLSFCKSSPNPLPIILGDPGGVFSASFGAVVDPVTGLLDLTATALGSHVISYTVGLGNCIIVYQQTITLTELAAAYPTDRYCQNQTDPIPFISDPGGVFSQVATNPSGLVLNAGTGVIDLDASTAGTFNILYTPGPGSFCAEDTLEVTIDTVPDVSFIYAQDIWCRATGLPATPIILGQTGGTFLAGPNTAVDPVTGIVDVDTATLGGHFIQYTLTNGLCTSVETYVIDITDIVSFQPLSDRYAICDNVIDTLQFGVYINYNGVVPPIATYQWSPSTNLNDPIIANPQAILLAPQDYILRYNDSICPEQVDTLKIIAPYPAQILPTNDIVICSGSSGQIGADVLPSNPDQIFTYSGTRAIQAQDTTYFTMNVFGVGPNRIDNTLINSLNVSLGFSMNSLNFSAVYLIAPSGETIPLMVNRGGLNLSFPISNFSLSPGNLPIATLPFSPPLTGGLDYFPEGGPGGFNNLLGATSNGTWTLMYIHNSGAVGGGIGNLADWSLNFKDLSASSFLWSPNNSTISCTVCDSPIVNPAVNTTYTVTSTNLFGCSDTAMVNVTIDTALPAAITTCGNLTSNSVTFNWAPVFGASGYSVSIDGGLPQTIAATLDSFQVIGLALNQCVTMVIIPLSGNTCADGAPDTITCCALGCTNITPTITPSGTTILCAGDSVDLDAGAGFSSYLWSTGAITPIIRVGATDTYTLTVTDASGCLGFDTLSVTVGTPLTVNLGVQDLSCNNMLTPDGRLVATALGSFGSYAYNWSVAGSSNDTLAGLASGTYCVTVTDSQGCSVDTCATIAEPTAITFTSTQTDVTCFGGSDGSATFIAIGGTGSLTYVWSNGQTTATATNLTAGLICVTITDVNGCAADTCLTIIEPTMTVTASASLVTTFAGARM